MAMPAHVHLWWDRETDLAGRPIRQDVRNAAHEFWEEACRQTEAVLADRAPAADLMERSVAEVSRYLDRVGAASSRPKQGLLRVAFRRTLRRHAAKIRRLELVGTSSELSERNVDAGWIHRVNARLDLVSMVRRLSVRNGQVLMLRAAGFEWLEIAQLFRTSATAVRNGFWREIRRVHGTG